MSEPIIRAREKKADANKKRREREQKKRNMKKAQEQPKRKKSASPELDESSDDAVTASNSKLTKKQRHDSEPEPTRITAYIHVQSTAPPTQARTSRARTKAEAPPVSIQGPCFFTTDNSFFEFRAILASTLPCRLSLLPSAQVQWKYEKPNNDTKKPLSNLSGYEAMVISLSERKKEHVVQIFMPPPKVLGYWGW